MKKFIILFLVQIFIVTFAVSIFAATLTHEYILVDGPTWLAAEANAVAWGGHLVTINDIDENNFLYNTFGNRHFIGLYSNGSWGNWQWISGENSSYRNWAPGEPNNSGNEMFTQLFWNSAGSWNDVNNDPEVYGYGNNYFTRQGIAEKVTPEPISSILFLLGGAVLGMIQYKKRKKD